MGFLDNLKDKAGDLGDKAKEGLGTAKHKASDLVEDVKERIHKDEEPEEGTFKDGDIDAEPPQSAAADDEVADAFASSAPTVAPGAGAAASQAVDPAEAEPSLKDEEFDAVQEEAEELKPDPGT